MSVGRVSFTVDTDDLDGPDGGPCIQVRFEHFETFPPASPASPSDGPGSDVEAWETQYACRVSGELGARTSEFLTWFTSVVEDGRRRHEALEELWVESGGEDLS